MLSATTTMELGIDIGGLSGVLLGNIPPGPSKLRSSGQAGPRCRRADGSSAVVAICRPRPYDREVFEAVDSVSSSRGQCGRPHVSFSNAGGSPQRHAHAWLLGTYFAAQRGDNERTGAMNAFARFGEFVGLLNPQLWSADMAEKPSVPAVVEQCHCRRFVEWLEATKSGGEAHAAIVGLVNTGTSSEEPNQTTGERS